jgi:hypothetical protein
MGEMETYGFHGHHGLFVCDAHVGVCTSGSGSRWVEGGVIHGVEMRL